MEDRAHVVETVAGDRNDLRLGAAYERQAGNGCIAQVVEGKFIRFSKRKIRCPPLQFKGDENGHRDQCYTLPEIKIFCRQSR